MASILPISAKHIVENGYNNTFRYQFVGANADLTNMEVAVASISMYNSSFNIESAMYSNNTFKIEVPTGSGVSLISVALNDGYYSYADINRMIQTELINAGAYLIDADGNYVFFIQLIENPSRYAAQLDVSATPTTLGTMTRPVSGLYSAGGAGLPTTTRTPALLVTNEEFGRVIGFKMGGYPGTTSLTPQSFLSNITPTINPVSSYSVRCSLINNRFTNPSDVLCTFDSQGTTIGQLISYKPNEFAWIEVASGSYGNISLTIVDQEERFVRFRDRNVLISLIFRPKERSRSV